MKFLLLASLFASFSSFAVDPHQICNLSTSSATIACLDVVSRTQHFDENALKTCGNLNSGSSVVDCMEIISEGAYESAVATYCNNMDYNSSTLICLKISKNKSYNPAALKVCSGISSSSSRVVCLNNMKSTPISQ